MISKREFPKWPENKIAEFNSHPMISNIEIPRIEYYQDFYDRDRYNILVNIPVENNVEPLRDTLGILLVTILGQANKNFNEKFFNKTMATLNKCEYLYKKEIYKEKFNKIKEDFK